MYSNNHDPFSDPPLTSPSSGLPQSFDDLDRGVNSFQYGAYPSNHLQQSASQSIQPVPASLPVVSPTNHFPQGWTYSSANTKPSPFGGPSNPFQPTPALDTESNIAPSVPSFGFHTPNNFASSQAETMPPTQRTPLLPKPVQNGSKDKEEGELSERELSKPRNSPPRSKKRRLSPQEPSHRYDRYVPAANKRRSNYQQVKPPQAPFGTRANQASKQTQKDSGRPLDRNSSFNQHAIRGGSAVVPQPSRAHGEQNNRFGIKESSPNAISDQAVREQRESGKRFIFELYGNNYGFLDLVKEGLDPTILRSLYEEIGITIDEDPTNSTSAQNDQTQLSVPSTAPMLNDSAPKTNNINTVKPPLQPITSVHAKAPPASQTSEGRTGSIVDNDKTTQSSKEAPKETQHPPVVEGPQPNNRSDYLARLAAAKTKKQIETLSPKSKTAAEARPAVRPSPNSQPAKTSNEGGNVSQALSKEASRNSPSKNDGRTKEQRESELARLRMQVLKSAKASSTPQPQGDAQKAPGPEEIKTIHNHQPNNTKAPQAQPSSAASHEQSMTVHSPPVASTSKNESQEPSLVSPSGIPGLLMSSEPDASAKSHSEHTSQSAVPSNATQAQEKEQDKFVFTDRETRSSQSGVSSLLPQQKPVASGNNTPATSSRPANDSLNPISLPTPGGQPSKRPFGAPRFGSSNDTCIIEASDDDSSEAGTNDGHTREQGAGTSSSTPRPTIKNIPVREKSAPPPHTPDNARKEAELKAQEAQIQEMKKKIEMIEQRKKMKALSARSDTPVATPDSNADLSDTSPTHNGVPKSSSGHTPIPGEDRSKILHLKKNAASEVGNAQSPAIHHDSSLEAQKRRAEIESSLTSADEKFASLSKEAEAKSKELERIREIIRVEEARKKELVDELERLGVDTADIPEEALEPVRDKVVADLQYYNPTERAGKATEQLDDPSTNSPPLTSSQRAFSSDDRHFNSHQTAENTSPSNQVQTEAARDGGQERNGSDLLSTNQLDARDRQPDSETNNLSPGSPKPNSPSVQAFPSPDGGDGSEAMSVDTPDNASSGSDVGQATALEPGSSRAELEKMDIDGSSSVENGIISSEKIQKSFVDNSSSANTPRSSSNDERRQEPGTSGSASNEIQSDEEYEPEELESRLNSNDHPISSEDEDEEYEPPEMHGARDLRASNPAVETDGSIEPRAILDDQQSPRVIDDNTRGPPGEISRGAEALGVLNLTKDSRPGMEADRFIPYASPLSVLKAYRRRSNPLDTSLDAFPPITKDNELEQQKPLCFWETNGGTCNDPHCEAQHFGNVALHDL